MMRIVLSDKDGYLIEITLCRQAITREESRERVGEMGIQYV